MSMPEIVTPDAWNAAREHLLVAEKELTRAKDALAAKRRRMPMTEVTKAYRFVGPEGTKTLAELFDGRRQLIVYRFFMDPDMKAYPERGCPGCSMFADHIGHLNHLRARDVNFVLVSRGEQEHLHRYREHMGWELPWYTLTDDFDKDHDVGEWHGTNVFFKADDGRIFRTYFVNNRGDEVGTLWHFLDLTPYGRQEHGRTRPRAGRRRRRTSGGTTTTATASARPSGNGSGAADSAAPEVLRVPR